MHENESLAQFDHDSMVDAVLTASRVLVAIAARSLADAGEQVTLTQYRSLVILASRGPQSMAALAEAVAVTPPTASRLCERLVRKGLVRRRADRRDRRQVRIALTEAGRAPDRHGDRASPSRDRRPAGIGPCRGPALGGRRPAAAGRQRR